MTVKECYEQMGSDYEGVLGRMGSEAMIKRFALKFLQDPSFNNLSVPRSTYIKRCMLKPRI